MSSDYNDLLVRMERDVVCMTAWAGGRGPYPETVAGVSAKHAERVSAAAAAIRDLQAQLAERDARISDLEAKVAQLERACIRAAAPDFMTDAEHEALVDFVKFLRSDKEARKALEASNVE